MKQKSIWIKILIYGLGIFLIFGIVYYLVGNSRLKQLSYVEEYSEVAATQITPTLTEGTMIVQKFITHADMLDGIVLRFATYNNTLKEGNINLVLVDSDDNHLYSATIPVDKLIDNEDYYVDFGQSINVVRNEELTLEIKEYDNNDGNVATLWAGEEQQDCQLYINGKKVNNTLYFNPVGKRNGNFKLYFGIAFIVLVGTFVLLCLYQQSKEEKGIKTGMSELVHIFDEYSFLLKQLIGRDFAVKYRRSYLGIVWVILNPLMTMIVLSAVFSFIFRFNIENFPVYLILGQIVFNCFSEATQVSITTITGSGQMIKKIYVPKYIFPLSKTLFSFLNFVLTFIPVILVMIYFKIPLTINVVYLPLLLISFFCFTLGVSFILSAMQVFMRDTQYLYGIFLTLMGYLTPIFYPVTSLSPLFQKIMLLNPLFHYMNVLRVILLHGETPTVQQMSACVIIGVIFLGVGIKYFFKRQKKFILYI